MSSNHSVFKQVFGILDVIEDEKNISITGVKTASLSREIMREWGTSRIESYMFSKYSSSRIVFPKFFAPEVAYMVDRLINKRGTANRRNLYTLLNELKNNTWLRNIDQPWTSKLDYSKLNLFIKKPLPHQREFFETYDRCTQLYGLKGYLLSAAAGSGKTLMDLMLAEMLGAQIKIIIAPKNSIYRVWDDTLRNEYRVGRQAWIPDSGATYNGEDYIVAHYEALDKVVAYVAKFRQKKVAVVLDESHNMNTPDSLRTMLFLDVCKKSLASEIIFASGTPVKAMGYETIPLMRAIDPLFTQDVEERFKKIYGRSASRGLDILAHRMGIVSYRVEKNEVMDNKPQDHEVKVKIPNSSDYTLKTIRREMEKFIHERLAYYKENYRVYRDIYDRSIAIFEKTLSSPAQWAEYREYQKTFAIICKGYDPQTMSDFSRFCNRYELNVIAPTLPRDLRIEFVGARSVIKYVELKVMGEALGGVLGKKRMQCHLDMIPKMTLPEIIEQTVKKTVVFSSYVQVVDEISNYLRDQDYKPSVVHGETNKDLPAIIQKFTTDPNCNPLIATYQSLSTAVPLTMANAAVMTNQPWRDHELIQARARIDRLSQDTPVHFYNILLDTGDEPNISTRSLDIVQWSREQVSKILGVPVPEDNVSMESLLDEPDNDTVVLDKIQNELALEDLLEDLAEDPTFY